jgi:hypothetical protein
VLCSRAPRKLGTRVGRSDGRSDADSDDVQSPYPLLPRPATPAWSIVSSSPPRRRARCRSTTVSGPTSVASCRVSPLSSSSWSSSRRTSARGTMPPPLYKTGAAQRRPCRPRDCNRLKPLVHLSRAPNWSGPYPRRAAISSTRTASTERWNLLREPGLCTESPALGVCCCVGKIAVVGRGTTRDIIGGAASC